jgi:hypothetical protein
MLKSLFQKVRGFLFEARNLYLIRTSGFFDEIWYLANNLDLAQSTISPLLHYLQYGGFEGRDLSPKFCSGFYLNKYTDVRDARINPLVHYLKYGRVEGRSKQPPTAKYRCPVCSERISEFSPIDSYYHDNRRKYGYPFRIPLMILKPSIKTSIAALPVGHQIETGYMHFILGRCWKKIVCK